MAIKETKTLRGFRMWKSGKRWLFGTAVIASVLLGGESKAFADSPVPTNPAVIEEVYSIPQDSPEKIQKDVSVGDDKTISSTVVATSGEQAGKENNERETVSKSKDSKEQSELTSVNTENKEHTVDTAVNEQIVKNAVSTADKLKPVAQVAQDVRIHYKPAAGDTRDYYAWVWGDTAQHQTSGRFLKMEKGGGSVS